MLPLRLPDMRLACGQNSICEFQLFVLLVVLLLLSIPKRLFVDHLTYLLLTLLMLIFLKTFAHFAFISFGNKALGLLERMLDIDPDTVRLLI